MPDLSVATDGSHLRRHGEFFPYVADTAWSAFADATEVDWVNYLRRRRAQGFTSIAVSLLPILHDRTVHPQAREPFAFEDTPDGRRYDFDRPDPAYVDNAVRFTELMAAEGLVPTLIVLWLNYLPGTWGAELTPGSVMTSDHRRAYVSMIAERFGPLQPILSISGDDRFDSEPANDAYREELEQLSREAPDCLITLHSSPDTTVPEDILDSPHLDFVTYQSGHDHARQERCWDLAQLYRTRARRLPVINLEPAYEHHGYYRGQGRYTALDVRRAIWSSLLGGGSAGFGYGAHGIWQWYRDGGRFTAQDTSLEPLPWASALRLRGGDDVGLIADLLVRHRLDRLDIAQDLMLDGGSVRVGSGDGVVAVYLPFTRAVTLRGDLRGYRVWAWDLEQRTPFQPVCAYGPDQVEIRQPDVAGDAVIIFER